MEEIVNSLFNPQKGYVAYHDFSKKANLASKYSVWQRKKW